MTKEDKLTLLKGIYHTAYRRKQALMDAEIALAAGHHLRWSVCCSASEHCALMHDTLLSLGHKLYEGGNWIVFDSTMEAVSRSGELHAASGLKLTQHQLAEGIRALGFEDDEKVEK